MAEKEQALIVGLGNPGKEYEKTRHNIGFAVVEELARQKGLSFQKEKKFKGEIAKGNLGENPAIILKPLTYMNLSGEAVEAVCRYYRIDLARALIITDDVDLPFGKLRIRSNSGPGTHNGLKSVEGCLRTNRYTRLRIGVGNDPTRELADYVLAKFSKEEEELLPQIIEKAVQAVQIWLDHGLTSAMNLVNRASTPSIGDTTC